MLSVQDLRLFVLGSSLPVFVVTMLYVGTAYRTVGRPPDVPMEIFAVAIPLMFGLFTVLNHRLIQRYGDHASIITGLLLAGVFSGVGRFVLRLPDKIFKIPARKQWRVHVYASVIYILIFRLIVTPLTHMLI